ncbi:MAG: MG2 domain-containing protein, partial [Saprospiraceae bacterium]
MKRFLFCLIVFSMTMASCYNKNDGKLLDVTKDREMLEEHFMAATVGVISTNDPLRYVLKEPLSSPVDEGVLQKVITLSPTTIGKVTLSNNTILTFTPDETLRPDATYTVYINLKSLDSKRFNKNIEYQIKTLAQDMKVEREGLIINDDASVSIMLGVKTADKVNPDKLKTCFKSDASSIEIIERAPMNYEMEFRFSGGMKKESMITYDGNNIGCTVKGTVELFDLNTKVFGVVYTHHNVQDKTFNIYFSQRLNKQMDLTGLLKVQNNNASYTIKNNVLTIFLGEIRDQNIVNITIDKSIRSTEGKSLFTNHSFDINVQVDSPEAQFVSDGNYFPSEGDFKIPIKTRALEKLRIVVIEIKQENVMHYLAWQSLTYADYYNLRMYGKPVFDQIVPLNQGIRDNEGWTVHGIDMSDRIQKNPGSIYHISMDIAPELTTLSCRSDLKKYKINSQIPSIDFFTKKDHYYNDYYQYYEDYDWEESNDPCKVAYYLNKQPANKLFICSDFSVIAKKAGKNYHIAFIHLMDLSHVSGADITLYNLQAEKIATLRTSSDGFANFENIQDDAAVLKIEKDRHVTYLALDPNDSNSLTEFDISGERSATDTEFFVYTDRDVWRPGDSIYVDLMVNKSDSDIPDGMPAVMYFYNQDNMIIDQQVQEIRLSTQQIYSFTLSTPANAKTGNYRCIFQVGPKTIRKNIRVETIKPNTAEVVYTFDDIVDKTIYSDHISGSLTAKYLTGFEISKANIKASARGRKISQPFDKYRDFVFDVMDNTNSDNNFDILDAMTNERGFATFAGDQNLKSFNSPINVSIETETILPGGGTNKEGKSIIVSPFESYVGAKRKEGSGWSGNHTFTENIEVSVVNLTDRGKPATKSNNISYILQQHIESWWVDKYRLRSSGNFVSADFWKDVPGSSGNLNIKGNGKITFPKGKLGKGAYKLTMTDETSGHASQVYFTVYDGIENIPGSQPYIVEFQTDKDEYKTGETVKVNLPDINGAKALISIERGNRVIAQSWHTLSASNNVIDLPTNMDWSPNAYIHVTIVQPYKNENNDLPIRMYGIKHVKMDGSASQLKPIASIPDKLESNRSYTFTVSEDEGRPMEYTLALVDEGLLNLTGFGTPDPAKHFNGKFPLLVKTWDIYKYLIAYFRGKFAGIISIGGDDAYNPDAIAEVNRFKPVAIHQGPFKLSKGGKNTHTVSIPNYIGKVRLMVVACNDHNFGKTEKFIPVKNPLMVQSQFPRTLNVSDKLQLPITILRDDASIATANLSAAADASMVKGFTANKALTFNGKNQLTHTYYIEVLNKTGPLTVEMGINGGGKSMKEVTNI